MKNPQWPPLPGNARGLDVWNLGDGLLVLDDRAVDYEKLRAEAELEAALEAALNSGGTQMRMMSSSLLNGYGNPVYLTNMTAIASGTGSMTASFSIAGGTNFVPYDILTTTNLANPLSNWTWLGLGYTSNNYTFTSQPKDLAFYILAKPSKTMVVGWGENADLQTDVPFGMTNAIMVAGGYFEGLALLTDQTIRSWGDNLVTSQPTNLAGVTMIAGGFNHNLALFTNGSVKVWGNNFYGELNMPYPITNGAVISP